MVIFLGSLISADMFFGMADIPDFFLGGGMGGMVDIQFILGGKTLDVGPSLCNRQKNLEYPYPTIHWAVAIVYTNPLIST